MFPFCNNVAVCPARPLAIELTVAQEPPSKSYISVADVCIVCPAPLVLLPPVINVRPFGSSVAVWPDRAVVIPVIVVQFPVPGSKISDDVKNPARVSPPVTITVPFGKTVAE